MKAVLRVTLAYFTYVPLMSWLALLGVPLLLLGVILHLAGVGQNGGALAPAIFGAVLIGIGPAFSGGAVLRYASSLSTTMLRPQARPRLLVGTTLALTLVALLATIPFLVDPATTNGRRPPEPAQVFQIAWSAMALNWTCVFALSRYRYGLVFIWLVPAVVSNLFRYIPEPELPEPSTLFAAGLVLWAGFSAWYLRRRTHGPVMGWNAGGMTQLDGATPPGSFYSPIKLPVPRSAAQAFRQLLLGGVSTFNYMVLGAGQALFIVIAFAWLTGRPGARETAALGNVLYIGVLMSSFMMGYWLVRRSRSLWLRTGLDRAGLFRLAETSGLFPALLSFASATAVIVIAQLWLRPDLLPTIALNAVVQLAFATTLAYWGLSWTRGWTFLVVLECGGMLALNIANLSLSRANGSFKNGLIALAVFCFTAVLLRVYAKHRWLGLDWRVAMPQSPNLWRQRAQA
jgi:hypothetical protein